MIARTTRPARRGWWLALTIAAAHSALISGYCTHLLAGGTP